MRRLELLRVEHRDLDSAIAALVDAGGGDMQAGIERLIELAAGIGIHDMFFIIGMIEDVFECLVFFKKLYGRFWAKARNARHVI